MDLPIDRLATTDAQGKRVYIYPADVQGQWKLKRTRLSAFLILLFITLPWLRVGGNPVLLLDIPDRRFSVLGVTFFAHDTPLLFLVVAAAALVIALITILWGRV